MNVLILGTRGIPAGHSGFETFAQQQALYMVSAGHSVTVYCQIPKGQQEFEDTWRGIRRIAFAEDDSPYGTVRFDLRSTLHASRTPNATVLTLGYNTAIFSVFHRLRGVRNIMNMDGIEWKREKWGTGARIWLRMNERLGSVLANHLVADHPEIKNHLVRNVNPSKITVIPYGADLVTGADPKYVRELGLEPGNYFLVIARSEPENSILEIIRAYTSRPRDIPLVILGRYAPEKKPYHAAVFEAAKAGNVIFPGAIFEPERVQALRFFATAYIHGHQVGGTNPSLVEALAAQNAVIGHDNRFNRWVCGSGARFFSHEQQLSEHLDALETQPEVREQMRQSSLHRFQDAFRKELIVTAYEQLLMGLPVEGSH